MTTVAFRDGVMASDSRYSDVSTGITVGPKLFKKKVGKKEHIIGICGDVYAAMVFVDWYGTEDKDLHKTLVDMTDDSFEVIIWDGKKLKSANRYCRLLEVGEPYFAIGSGGVHAITAMDCGKSSIQAVQLAMKRDPYSGGRIINMRLT